jgi:hypothetical protein
VLLASNQESTARLQRNQELSFEAQVVCRARSPAATALAEPLIGVIVTGTVVVPR